MPTITPANGAATQHAHSLKLLCPRTGKGITHSTASAEPRCEARALVHAEITLNLLYDSVNEGHIFAVGVGPTSISTIRSYQDCAALRSSFKPIPELNALTVHDRVHVPTAPVEAEDEMMRSGCILVVRDLEDLLAVVDFVDPTGKKERRGFEGGKDLD
ncbi:hypothetical protein BBP40_002197 [Aspergillus hancockii]|nr:hypothetical protein BBP40_002197 [Aspergillus hancockii]